MTNTLRERRNVHRATATRDRRDRWRMRSTRIGWEEAWDWTLLPRAAILSERSYTCRFAWNKTETRCLTVKHAFRDVVVPAIGGAGRHPMTLESTSRLAQVYHPQGAILEHALPHYSPSRWLHQRTLAEDPWKRKSQPSPTACRGKRVQRGATIMARQIGDRARGPGTAPKV